MALLVLCSVLWEHRQTLCRPLIPAVWEHCRSVSDRWFNWTTKSEWEQCAPWLAVNMSANKRRSPERFSARSCSAHWLSVYLQLCWAVRFPVNAVFFFFFGFVTPCIDQSFWVEFITRETSQLKKLFFTLTANFQTPTPTTIYIWQNYSTIPLTAYIGGCQTQFV